ncbi:hypothetical protein FGB62_6g243 [Gracilaria domingensis]|nr:hypothetical protein FGB62_6g243 [Gracilaria domingensis]
MPPSRLNIDRNDNPLGKHKRPFPQSVAPNLPQQKAEDKAVPDSQLRDKDKVERRRDSTENPSFSKKELVSHTAKLFVSVLSRMLPVQDQPQTSSQIWDRVLCALHAKNFESARKSMLDLQKHSSSSRTAFVNRRRALSILAVLVAVDEWSAKAPLSSKNSQLLSAGIAHGCPDAIAFGSWFHLKERWNTSPMSFEEICDLLVKAARHRHPACQAVLGIMLSPSSRISRSFRRQLRAACLQRVECELQNRQILRVKFRNPTKCRNLQEIDVKSCLDSRLNQDIQMLKEAASQGYFLALDQLERETQNERMVNSRNRIQEEDRRLETHERRVSPQEFFSCVQSAANRQIPYCAVRLAKILENGTGCERSEDDARLWLQAAANLNVPVAMFEIHATAKNENQQLSAKLSRKLRENDLHEFHNSAEGHRANATLKKNFLLLQRCEENISRWRKEQEQQKRVLAFHCNW